MTSFPGAPHVLKGAIVSVAAGGAPPSVILFQYNPDTLTRTLRAQTTGGETAGGDVMRLKGPPEETIKLDVEIDATDQLELGNPSATALGLHPTLAALEMLLYPPSATVIANHALAAAGMIAILEPEMPLTLFVWGAGRILPVRITDFSITEEAFDPALNPIRAKVNLGLRVLTYNDLGLASPGGAFFMAHQIAKEVMARLGTSDGSVLGPLASSIRK
jgi:hypothetical protein